MLRQYDAFLAIGSANRDFYRFHRRSENRIFWSPYAVDNDLFAAQAAARAGARRIARGIRLPGRQSFSVCRQRKRRSAGRFAGSPLALPATAARAPRACGG
jgi:hypothetical protein